MLLTVPSDYSRQDAAVSSTGQQFRKKLSLQTNFTAGAGIIRWIPDKLSLLDPQPRDTTDDQDNGATFSSAIGSGKRKAPKIRGEGGLEAEDNDVGCAQLSLRARLLIELWLRA